MLCDADATTSRGQTQDLKVPLVGICAIYFLFLLKEFVLRTCEILNISPKSLVIFLTFFAGGADSAEGCATSVKPSFLRRIT